MARSETADPIFSTVNSFPFEDTTAKTSFLRHLCAKRMSSVITILNLSLFSSIQSSAASNELFTTTNLIS